MDGRGARQVGFGWVEVVLYGPPWAGKTTALRALHGALPPRGRTPIRALGAASPQLIFEAWPSASVRSRGLPLKLRVRAVPGEWDTHPGDGEVLRGADAVIFLADSTPSRLQDDIAWFQRLEECLRAQGKALSALPLVMAWNKRDLPNALPTAVLQERLSRYRYEAPAFPTVATEPRGLRLCLQVATWMAAEARERARRPA